MQIKVRQNLAYFHSYHKIYLSYTECIVDTEDGNCGLRLSLCPLDSLFPKEAKIMLNCTSFISNLESFDFVKQAMEFIPSAMMICFAW